MADEGTTDTRAMVPLGHDGPAPWGIRYRWDDTPVNAAMGNEPRERFFISEAERDKWQAPRLDRIETLALYNPPTPGS